MGTFSLLYTYEHISSLTQRHKSTYIETLLPRDEKPKNSFLSSFCLREEQLVFSAKRTSTTVVVSCLVLRMTKMSSKIFLTLVTPSGRGGRHHHHRSRRRLCRRLRRREEDEGLTTTTTSSFVTHALGTNTT